MEGEGDVAYQKAGKRYRISGNDKNGNIKIAGAGWEIMQKKLRPNRRTFCKQWLRSLLW